jgi:hypothetical protein
MMVLQKAKDLPLPIIPSHQGRGNMTLFSGIEIYEPGKSRPESTLVNVVNLLVCFAFRRFY